METQNVRLHHFLERILNRFLFRRSPGVKTEIACWRAAQSSDLIYSVCGPLSLSRFYQRTKLISWVFRMPQILTKQAFDPYSSKNLNSHSAFLCLTPDAEEASPNTLFRSFCHGASTWSYLTADRRKKNLIRTFF